MSSTDLILLAVLFLVTSIIGVVTGSNSLITVPVMFQFGIDEKVAVATNMFGLTFMAIGGTIPFFRRRTVKVGTLTPLIILTIVGSAIGAILVGLITNQAIKIVVTVAMIVMVVFTLVRRDRQTVNPETPRDDPKFGPALFAATFLLAIYGGLYSGGYVTVLTAAIVALSALSFTEAIAATKFINVFSSGIATLIFMWQGLVYYRLGIVLAVAMFVGAYIGAHYATKLNDVWLRRIFVSTVLLLAIKLLVDAL